MTAELPATPETVARHYDAITPFYEIIGSRSLHFGYWPRGEVGGSFGEAQHRFTDLLIGQLGSQQGQRVLDVGCGLGEPAIQLARSTGCVVEGITISSKQAAQAEQWARRHEPSGQTTFRCADAMALPFPVGSFDAAWAVESLFHMPDHATVLRELARVLRPNGRLLVADIVLSADATPRERAFLQHAFVARTFITAEAYPELVGEAGFEVEQVLDVSAHVMATFDAVAAAIQEKEAEVLRAYGAEFLAGVKAQWARISESASRCMGYVVLTAKRRSLET
ncbi:SAM-dependent methyltransferase [Pyxidicoccus sp. MSG2]|uniref:SAM-dependent methyltransferase n=1 Tax=Pyxidicoccus sp. MSG2 TaxID=2996790 RepID=UPI002270606D|nr:methyltransferase domain-containing protein [Pyxidicoccus sp. MSG2]MCY1021342.1 methyltransferase domain-containing protein [Pyxidicoccus sp. MSG2]